MQGKSLKKLSNIKIFQVSHKIYVVLWYNDLNLA